jgi:hypothetical protein
MPRAKARSGDGTIGGNTLAGIASASVGHPYIWGSWDCSGAFNHWVSQAGGAIPGYGPGQFKGPPPHGPVVAQWATWNGASTIPTAEAEPGDACVWPGLLAGGHIGMCIGTKAFPKYGVTSPVLGMVSALDTTDGTVETPVHGFGPAGVPMIVRRLHSVAPGTGAILPPGGCGSATAAGLITIGEIAKWLTTTHLPFPH